MAKPCSAPVACVYCFSFFLSRAGALWTQESLKTPWQGTASFLSSTEVGSVGGGGDFPFSALLV